MHFLPLHHEKSTIKSKIMKEHTNSKGFLRVNRMHKKLRDEMFCFCLMHMRCSLGRFWVASSIKVSTKRPCLNLYGSMYHVFVKRNICYYICAPIEFFDKSFSFSCAFSRYHIVWILFHNWSKWMVVHRYELVDDFLLAVLWWISCYNGDNRRVYPLYGFFHVSAYSQLAGTSFDSMSSWMVYPLCGGFLHVALHYSPVCLCSHNKGNGMASPQCVSFRVASHAFFG